MKSLWFKLAGNYNCYKLWHEALTRGWLPLTICVSFGGYVIITPFCLISRVTFMPPPLVFDNDFDTLNLKSHFAFHKKLWEGTAFAISATFVLTNSYAKPYPSTPLISQLPNRVNWPVVLRGWQQCPTEQIPISSSRCGGEAKPPILCQLMPRLVSQSWIRWPNIWHCQHSLSSLQHICCSMLQIFFRKSLKDGQLVT